MRLGESVLSAQAVVAFGIASGTSVGGYDGVSWFKCFKGQIPPQLCLNPLNHGFAAHAPRDACAKSSLHGKV